MSGVSYSTGEYDAAERQGTQANARAGLLSGLPLPVLTGAGALLLVLLAFAAGVLWRPGGATPGNSASTLPGAPAAVSRENAVRVGAPAPDFELADAITGERVRLSSLRGRPVWINFWAGWCEACRVEMPAMQKTYDAYKDRGLAILGVDVDGDPAEARKFLEGKGFTWTFLLDNDGLVTGRYMVQAIPTHWFVDKQGTLRAVHVGGIPDSDLKGYLAKVLGE